MVYQPRSSDSSVGKEFTCSAGGTGLILGLGRSAGEGIGYPHQYSWASLVAQMLKNPPTMQEGLGLIPGLGMSPGEGKGYPLQYSAGEFHGLYNPWGHRESDMTEWLSLYQPHSLGLWHWRHLSHFMKIWKDKGKIQGIFSYK